MLARLSIRLKLTLLAGAPVLGALVLAMLMAGNARREAQSAAALGSIESLARLSTQMGGLVHELQQERTECALRMALKTPAVPELQQRFDATDAAQRSLHDFLAARQLAPLPPRLARDVQLAVELLRGVKAARELAVSGKQPITELLGYYETVNRHLISATATLAQLTQDGEMMRAIAALVAVMEIKERLAQEQALLGHVFGVDSFPPGTYKALVTLLTEQADYVNVLEVNASDAVNQRFQAELATPEFRRAAELRKVAVETLSDELGVSAMEWVQVQGVTLTRLRALVISLNGDLAAAASAKEATATRAARISYGIGTGVVLCSALLAWLLGRGVMRSVGHLAHAAERVRKEQDFSIRAVKSSEDEIGRLADSFNEMLSGLQHRDDELRAHREGLERLVSERTQALQQRNDAMRLVLDNVDQGLATVVPSGSLAPERSRAFDEWFGQANDADTLADRLGQQDEAAHAALRLGWEQVVEGFLPLDAALAQMPRQIAVGERQYELTYRGIKEGEVLKGVLLVVSDITLEQTRRKLVREQNELICIFEAVARDRTGFLEFFREGAALVQRVCDHSLRDSPQALLSLHTLKGNCRVFGVQSVADLAHDVESSIARSGGLLDAAQTEALRAAWSDLERRLSGVLGATTRPPLEVTADDLETLKVWAQKQLPHAQLLDILSQLKGERALVRLQRLAEQAKALARQLGKGEISVQIAARSEVRFETERWAPFWAAFVHALRNAVDHGLEPSDERAAQGKQPGRLTIEAQSDGQYITLELSDDGRGIDWAGLAHKAQARGLPHTTELELTELLFTPGLSTAATLTEVSGRGIGLGAVRAATGELGGSIQVESAPGTGTTLRFRIPI
ncbi:MAG: hypothetical protein RJA70_3581 [Pseudomonadota bacterium]|jgi:two-component system chemotaxis sensor kinase CheA